jgi:hypothetical protein
MPLKTTAIEAPHEGMVAESRGPDALGKYEAEYIENFLIGKPGVLKVRGPSSVIQTDYNSNTTKAPVGAWARDDGQYVITRSNYNDRLMPWQTVWPGATAGSPARDTGTTYVFATNATIGTGSCQGRPVRVGNTVYAMSYDGAGTTTTSLGFPGPVAEYRKITSVEPGAPYIDNSGDARYTPHSGQAIASHLGRLWYLGGYAPRDSAAASTIPFTPNSLWYSRNCENTSLDFASSSEWRDEEDNTLNQIVIGNDPSEWGVGLAVVNRSLVIFKNNAVWVLYGDGPDSFSLRKVMADVGCIEPNSIYEADDGVYFLSKRGMEFFDGNTSYVISEAINPWLEKYTQDPYNISLSLSCHVGTVGDYVRVTLEHKRVANSRITLMYHRQTRGWVVFSGTGFDPQPFAISHDVWISGTQLRGYSGVCRDFVRGFSTYIDCNANVKYRRITPQTAAFGVQLHRFTIDTRAADYSTQAVNVESAATVWSVTGFESTGDTVMDTKLIQAEARVEAGNTKYPTGRRSVMDEFKEAHDFQLKIEYTNTGADIQMAEVYDAALEWQESNQRRSTRPR